MATLQPACCWRPLASQRSPVMAGTIGVPVAVSFTPFGLEIRECRAKLLSECSRKRNLAAGRNDSRGRGERGRVVLARRGGGGGTSRGAPKQDEQSRNSSTISTKNSVKEPNREDDERENEFDEDALEALFAQLEMDLEGGGISDDEDLTEEEVAELENELAAALRDIEEEQAEELRTIDVAAGKGEAGPGFNDPNGDSKSVLRSKKKGKSDGQNTSSIAKDEFADVMIEESADEEDEQRVITLEPWQLRKLAAAVEIGRRKVNIKALSAEVGMDRFDVLAWLKNPPPELLMYYATMESEESAGELPLETSAPNNSLQNLNQAGKQDLGTNPEGVPNWQSQKRLRKEHEATFERVFSNTDRPSNAILQNLVELTHVPRKRIVEWFEHRRKSVRPSPNFEALR